MASHAIGLGQRHIAADHIERRVAEDLLEAEYVAAVGRGSPARTFPRSLRHGTPTVRARVPLSPNRWSQARPTSLVEHGQLVRRREAPASRSLGDFGIGDRVHRPRMHARPRECRRDRHVGEPPFPPSFSNQRRRGVSPNLGREGIVVTPRQPPSGITVGSVQLSLTHHKPYAPILDRPAASLQQ